MTRTLATDQHDAIVQPLVSGLEDCANGLKVGGVRCAGVHKFAAQGQQGDEAEAVHDLDHALDQPKANRADG